MFKQCKCGQGIPKEWPRCGECQAKRAVVDMHQRMEGRSYRDKVAKRSSASQTLAKLRGKNGTPDEVSPDLEAIQDAQEQARKTIARMRSTDQRKLRKEYMHDNLAPALKRWMEDED